MSSYDPYASIRLGDDDDDEEEDSYGFNLDDEIERSDNENEIQRSGGDEDEWGVDIPDFEEEEEEEEEENIVRAKVRKSYSPKKNLTGPTSKSLRRSKSPPVKERKKDPEKRRSDLLGSVDHHHPLHSSHRGKHCSRDRDRFSQRWVIHTRTD